MSRIRVKPCGGIEVSEVKRYDPDDSIDLYEVADGEWVLHSDYATLSAELAQSRAREARLIYFLRQESEIERLHGHGPIEEIETLLASLPERSVRDALILAAYDEAPRILQNPSRGEKIGEDLYPLLRDFVPLRVVREIQ